MNGLVEQAEEAAKAMRAMDETDDRSNGIEVSENHARIATTRIRQELAGQSVVLLAIATSLRWVCILLAAIVALLAVLVTR